MNTYLLDPLLPYDAVEAVNWARNAEWGSPKNPWLPGMMMRPLFWFTDYSPTLYWYVIHFLCSIIGMAGCWALSYKLTKQRMLAWVGMLILMLSGTTNFDIIPYNDNYLLIMLWPWSIFCFLHAIERDSRFWILFGLLGGLSLMAKYSSAAVIFPPILCTFFSLRIRKHYRQPWIWLGWGVGLLLTIPNLFWLLEHNFAAYHWVSSEIKQGVNAHALISIVCVFYPLAFLVGYLYHKGGKLCWPTGYIQLIAVVCYAPVLFFIIIWFSLFDGGRLTEWLQPFMILGPAIVFACLSDPADVLPGKKIIGCLSIFGLLVAIGYAAVMVGNVSNAGKKMRGISMFSRHLESKWESLYGRPLRFVGGERLSQWITLYASSAPETVTRWDNDNHPNVYNSHISLEDILRDGVLLVGNPGERCPSTVSLNFQQQWGSIPITFMENTLFQEDEQSAVQWICIGYVQPEISTR